MEEHSTRLNHAGDTANPIHVVQLMMDELNFDGGFIEQCNEDAIENGIQNLELYGSDEYDEIDDALIELRKDTHTSKKVIAKIYKLFKDDEKKPLIYKELEEVFKGRDIGETDMSINCRGVFDLINAKIAQCNRYQAQYESIKESLDEKDITLMMEKVMDKTENVQINDIKRVEEL